MVDVSCGGTFMMKSEDEAWTLFENLRRELASKTPKTETLCEIGHTSDVAT